MWWAKQSDSRNSLLGSPQCCLPPVKSQAGPEMAETVTFFSSKLISLFAVGWVLIMSLILRRLFFFFR